MLGRILSRRVDRRPAVLALLRSPLFGISSSGETAAVIGLGLCTAPMARSRPRRHAVDQPRPMGGCDRAQLLPSRHCSASSCAALINMLPPFGNSLVLLSRAPRSPPSSPCRNLTFQSTLVVTRTLAVVPTFTCRPLDLIMDRACGHGRRAPARNQLGAGARRTRRVSADVNFAFALSIFRDWPKRRLTTLAVTFASFFSRW